MAIDTGEKVRQDLNTLFFDVLHAVNDMEDVNVVASHSLPSWQ